MRPTATAKYLVSFVQSLTILAIVCFLCTSDTALAADSKGKTEAVTPGFWAVRDGERVELPDGSDIYEFDILHTDANGSGTVRFIDDTTLEIRSNTEIDVKEVVFTESRNRFNVGLMEGSAKVVTGAIVKQNPRGFKMTTPNSTVGIRGTTIDGQTTGVDGTDTFHVVTENIVSITDRMTGINTSFSGELSYTSERGSISVDGVQVSDLGVSVGGIGLGVIENARVDVTHPDGTVNSNVRGNERGQGGTATGQNTGGRSGGDSGDSAGDSTGGTGGSGGGGGCGDSNTSGPRN